MKNKYLEELIEEVIRLKNKEEAEDFLRGILTPQEFEQLTLRLQIVKRLRRGEAQREIASDLGVGIATVTRGSRELRKGRFKSISG